MDFIVLGTGLGALLLVASVILRGVVPQRLAVASDELSWLVVRQYRRRARLAAAAGRVAVLGGALLLIVTGLLVLFDAPNALGWSITLLVSFVALGAVAGWALWCRTQDSSGAATRNAARAAVRRIDATREQRRAAEEMRSESVRRSAAGPDHRANRKVLESRRADQADHAHPPASRRHRPVDGQRIAARAERASRSPDDSGDQSFDQAPARPMPRAPMPLGGPASAVGDRCPADTARSGLDVTRPVRRPDGRRHYSSR